MRALAVYPAYAVLVLLAYFALPRLFPEGRPLRDAGLRGALAALAVASVTFAISEPQHRMFEDFTEAYYAGGAAVLSGISEAQRLFSSGVHGFVNVPIVAVLFVPFAILPEWLAAGVYTLLGVAATVLAWRLLVQAAGLDARGAAVLGALFVLNGPLANSLREGNTTHFTLLALAAALLDLRNGRDWRAGLFLGAAALFKLPLLLFGVYFVLRGRFRVVLAAGLLLAGLGVASIALFGLDAHLIWYREFVAGAGRAPIAAFNVQSVAAFFARLERGAAALCDWEPGTLGASARLVSQALVALTFLVPLAATLLAGRKRREPSPAAFELEYSLVLMLAGVGSPLAWTHYFAWLLLPAAFGLSAAQRALECRNSRRVFWLGVALAAPPVVFPLCTPPGWLELPYLVLTSHYLVGGLLVLFTVALHRYRAGPLGRPRFG